MYSRRLELFTEAMMDPTGICLLCPKLGDDVRLEKFKEQCYIMFSILVGDYWGAASILYWNYMV
jgi:hypothetical protein